MRSRPAKIRQVEKDPIYGNVTVTKLINRVMFSGKRDPAKKQVYRALELIKVKTGQEPLATFLQAIENIKPQMEVKARRIGGAAYQVPIPVRPVRKESLAIRWLIQAAKARSGSEFKTFADKLSVEIIDAYNNAGAAIKKKLDTYKMAEANKAFAHFRW